ncbi:hypothetical protein AYI92_06660 [Shewanella xiamenensis]|uniref:fimbrial protein n=1 Tax=Shewanella xiamenensis TaxID=332186 RepID=UPI0011871188|nr:fimbrial protein [Shewanella xiamenensis]TVL21168.1 hypothetical protein AYI90_07045 [Shewanella xiamenensis]TVL21339.1 hypothetical protein AYI91_07825 [Shewanella xiamenensis]TVL27375.1 hypothetical protein AYI92_06660 [Shewanella xiamenensis]TVL34922.1 hypothetical protein AYI93_07275 [Shewanella xiamenensis]TVL35952.1 hypothetical protein AYI95_00305 [Shewanella xiamenensis]
MKKYSAYLLIAMGCFAGAAHANSDVKFAGSVSNTTCDLIPDTGISGVAGLLQLGTVAPSAVGTAKEVVLRLDNNQAGCAALPDAAIATISWMGNLDSRGVINQNGTASDAWVRFTTVNAEGGTQADITSTKSSADFIGSTLKADGAKFSAVLNGGTNPGTFVSASAFVVSYP